LDQVIALLKEEELDVIFIEGLKSLVAQRKDIPKIVTGKNLRDLKRILNETVPPILAISGLVARKKTRTNEFETPIIDLLSDGELLLKMVKNQITCKEAQ
jgi:molybdopterin-guanine dinucleotide biosynthesis protein